VTVDLPDDLTARPPAITDLDAVVAVLRADEASSTGAAYTTAEDMRSDWSRPSIDLARDAVCVVDATGRVVGYADHALGRAFVGVLPDCHGRGIGSFLRVWSERRAAELGEQSVGQTVPEGNPAARSLLAAAGYQRRWDSWVFSVPLVGDLPQPQLPAGLELRPLTRPDEDEAVYDVIETAFSEWPDRGRSMPFADWRAAHLDRTDVEVLVVAGPDGLAGGAVCIDEGAGEGWVEQLAVAKGYRGQGLGRALLQGAFRRFAARGCATAGLSTDSRTGARTLYEHVGMRVTESFARWAKEL
jgi:mycothiol synthase